MKTIEEIKSEILNCEKQIVVTKELMESRKDPLLANGDSEVIHILKRDIELLKWVLNESV